MGKIESTIKSEIERLAKHEVKVVFRPLRKEVWGIRLKLSNLLKAFAPMNRLAKEISESKAKGPKLAASPEEVKASRFTPERIRGLRNKLGISQRELGNLVDLGIVKRKRIRSKIYYEINKDSPFSKPLRDVLKSVAKIEEKDNRSSSILKDIGNFISTAFSDIEVHF